jgi:hypothetical protein
MVAVAKVVLPITTEDFASATEMLATGTGAVEPPPPQAIEARKPIAAAHLTRRWNDATRARWTRTKYRIARINTWRGGARKEGNANIGQMFTLSSRFLADRQTSPTLESWLDLTSSLDCVHECRFSAMLCLRRPTGDIGRNVDFLSRRFRDLVRARLPMGSQLRCHPLSARRCPLSAKKAGTGLSNRL